MVSVRPSERTPDREFPLNYCFDIPETFSIENSSLFRANGLLFPRGVL